jgi:ADP-heptose:LPS heptosyltransferase
MARLGLDPNGVVSPSRMQYVTPGEATRTPAIKVSRLQHLMKTGAPYLCIVRGEGIGDVITTTPTVAAIKGMFPKSQLTFATNTRYLDGALVKVLKGNPYIDQVIDRDHLGDDYDLVINLHCPAFSYEKRENPPISRIDLFANHAGVKLADPVPQYYIDKKEIETGRDFLTPVYSDKLILVQPFASTPNRCLEHGVLKSALVRLYNEKGIRSVIITHSRDWQSDTLWDNVPGCVTLMDADIRQIAGVMVHCDLVLCPDSSIMHLAGALGVPTVAIFGPTHPAARINHYKNAVAIWGGEGLAPCPCWYEACPIGGACWKQVTPERIVESCLIHLSQTSRVKPQGLFKRRALQTDLL